MPNLQRRYRETQSDYIRSELERYMTARPCPTCEGKRLRPEALAVTITDLNIDQVSHFSVTNALAVDRAAGRAGRSADTCAGRQDGDGNGQTADGARQRRWQPRQQRRAQHLQPAGGVATHRLRRRPCPPARR